MKDNPPIRLLFRYAGKDYPIECRDKITFVHWDEELGEWSWFWWEYGNGDCDCNRSLEIQRHYPDFPEMECGNTIELVDYEVLVN